MGGSRAHRPLAEFLASDGTKVLVALPSAAAALRQKHAATEGKRLDAATTALGVDVDVELAATAEVRVVVHGSDEHQGLLRAAQAHHANRRAAVLESLMSIRRAGADAVLTYWAVEAARWLRP